MTRGRFPVLVLAVGVAAALSGCGSAPTAQQNHPSTTSSSPTANYAPTALPTAPPASPVATSPCPPRIEPLPGLCVGREATQQEEAALIAVGRPAMEADLGLKEPASCSGTDHCFVVGNPSRAMVAAVVGTFYGTEHSASGPEGSGCWVFLYEDATGWHYVNARCAQSEGYFPGHGDRVFVAGCANVRDAPGLSAGVLGCLANGTVVDVDSAPTYLDGHIWWHLANHGWMAHDFLVAPKNCNC